MSSILETYRKKRGEEMGLIDLSNDDYQDVKKQDEERQKLIEKLGEDLKTMRSPSITQKETPVVVSDSEAQTAGDTALTSSKAQPSSGATPLSRIGRLADTAETFKDTIVSDVMQGFAGAKSVLSNNEIEALARIDAEKLFGYANGEKNILNTREFKRLKSSEKAKTLPMIAVLADEIERGVYKGTAEDIKNILKQGDAQAYTIWYNQKIAPLVKKAEDTQAANRALYGQTGDLINNFANVGSKLLEFADIAGVAGPVIAGGSLGLSQAGTNTMPKLQNGYTTEEVANETMIDVAKNAAFVKLFQVATPFLNAGVNPTVTGIRRGAQAFVNGFLTAVGGSLGTQTLDLLKKDPDFDFIDWNEFENGQKSGKYKDLQDYLNSETFKNHVTKNRAAQILISSIFSGLFNTARIMQDMSINERRLITAEQAAKLDPQRHKYLETLGLKDGATNDEIKAAYRRLSKQYHPDAATGNEEMFKKVAEAYNNLIPKPGLTQIIQSQAQQQGGTSSVVPVNNTPTNVTPTVQNTVVPPPSAVTPSITAIPNTPAQVTTQATTKVPSSTQELKVAEPSNSPSESSLNTALTPKQTSDTISTSENKPIEKQLTDKLPSFKKAYVDELPISKSTQKEIYVKIYNDTLNKMFKNRDNPDALDPHTYWGRAITTIPSDLSKEAEAELEPYTPTDVPYNELDEGFKEGWETLVWRAVANAYKAYSDENRLDITDDINFDNPYAVKGFDIYGTKINMAIGGNDKNAGTSEALGGVLEQKNDGEVWQELENGARTTAPKASFENWHRRTTEHKEVERHLIIENELNDEQKELAQQNFDKHGIKTHYFSNEMYFEGTATNDGYIYLSSKLKKEALRFVGNHELAEMTLLKASKDDFNKIMNLVNLIALQRTKVNKYIDELLGSDDVVKEYYRYHPKEAAKEALCDMNGFNMLHPKSEYGVAFKEIFGEKFIERIKSELDSIINNTDFRKTYMEDSDKSSFSLSDDTPKKRKPLKKLGVKRNASLTPKDLNLSKKMFDDFRDNTLKGMAMGNSLANRVGYIKAGLEHEQGLDDVPFGQYVGETELETRARKIYEKLEKDISAEEINKWIEQRGEKIKEEQKNLSFKWDKKTYTVVKKEPAKRLEAKKKPEKAPKKEPVKKLGFDAVDKEKQALEKANNELKDKLAKQEKDYEKKLAKKDEEIKSIKEKGKQKDVKRKVRLEAKKKEQSAEKRFKQATPKGKLRILGKKIEKQTGYYEINNYPELDEVYEREFGKTIRQTIQTLHSNKILPYLPAKIQDVINTFADETYLKANWKTFDKYLKEAIQAKELKELVESSDTPVAKRLLTIIQEHKQAPITIKTAKEMYDDLQTLSDIVELAQERIDYRRQPENWEKTIEQSAKELEALEKARTPKNLTGKAAIRDKTIEKITNLPELIQTLKTRIQAAFGGNPDSPFKVIWDKFEEGREREAMLDSLFAKNFSDFVEKAAGGWKYKRELEEDFSKDAPYIDTGITGTNPATGKPYKENAKLSKDIIMHIVASSKNDDNLMSFSKILLGTDYQGNPVYSNPGGYVVPDEYWLKRGKIGEAYEKGKKYVFSEEEINHLESLLTDTEKKFVEASLKVGDISAKYGNEISQKLIGRDLFSVKNYIRIIRDPNTFDDDLIDPTKLDNLANATADKYVGIGGILGRGGSLEGRNHRSTRPIYGESLLQSVTRSFAGAKKYTAYALPLYDADYILNSRLPDKFEKVGVVDKEPKSTSSLTYKKVDELPRNGADKTAYYIDNGDSYTVYKRTEKGKTMKQLLTSAGEESFIDYYKQFVDGVVGRGRKNSKLAGIRARVVLNANLRVAATQFFSYFQIGQFLNHPTSSMAKALKDPYTIFKLAKNFLEQKRRGHF